MQKFAARPHNISAYLTSEAMLRYTKITDLFSVDPGKSSRIHHFVVDLFSCLMSASCNTKNAITTRSAAAATRSSP